MMTKAINEASQSSQADITKLIFASNKLSISGTKVSGDFTLSNIKQKT